jgi:phenylacetate-coenzyme A ligase PaaK-like adenylate-forming protein
LRVCDVPGGGLPVTDPTQRSELWPQILAALQRAASSSPFYRAKLAAAGIDVADLREPDDLARLPLTRKSEIPAAQQASPPFGSLLAVAPERIANVSVSPGPIYIARTAEEPTGVEALHESLRHMGVRRDDVAHVTLSYHIMPGGLRMHRAFESFGCRVINGGTGNSELQVRVASELGATVYVGTPSFLANLADVAAQQGRNLGYRVGFSTAEALTPAIRAEMGERLGIELFDHCGEALIGPLAGECHAHDGMHLHWREMLVEFLDPETAQPVSPGAVGEAAVTQLGERAMPLLRYAPGDLFQTYAEPCSCGEASPRIRFVGQVGGIRKIKGVLVHPAQVRTALAAFPELGDFQITVDRPTAARYDRAVIRIACAQTPDTSLAQRVAERLKANVLIQMDVELVSPDRIPAAAGPPRFTEAVVDLRHG